MLEIDDNLFYVILADVPPTDSPVTFPPEHEHTSSGKAASQICSIMPSHAGSEFLFQLNSWR